MLEFKKKMQLLRKNAMAKKVEKDLTRKFLCTLFKMQKSVFPS